MQPYESDIQACLQAFEQNRAVLYPTDTVWGLGCPATNEAAILDIFRIKQRPTSQSFILLMTDAKQLRNYLANPMPDIEAFLSPFTTPTTVIYPNGINLPSGVIASDGSIAVRITKDPFCRSLIKRIREPLVSTSANISKQPTAGTFIEISAEIRVAAGHVVQWRQSETEVSQPSTLLKLQPDGSLLKLR